MSTTPVARPSGVADSRLLGDGPPRRVRHQARDVVAVMTFSAGTSIAIAAVILLAGGVLGSGR